jgi:transcriptional regulator with XRE-family HTH domain
MTGLTAEVAFDLGKRIREGRLRRGMRQLDVEAATGVSTSTISRMELGHGMATPLGAWLDVASAVGVDLFSVPADPDRIYRAAIAMALAGGGWRMGGRRGIVWFDRAARQDPRLRNLRLPAERVVVRIARVVTQLDVEFDRLEASVREVRATSPPGLVVQGALILIRTSATVRRVGRRWTGRSTPGWISAFRSSLARIPPRAGSIWLEPRGTHLLPAA